MKSTAVIIVGLVALLFLIKSKPKEAEPTFTEWRSTRVPFYDEAHMFADAGIKT